MSLLYVQNITIPFLEVTFSKNPLSLKLSGNSNKLHKFCEKFLGLAERFLQPQGNSNPFYGGVRSMAIFWNCTISSANSSAFMFLNVS